MVESNPYKYGKRGVDSKFVGQDWNTIETVGNLVGEYGLSSLPKIGLKLNTFNSVAEYNKVVDAFTDLTTDIQFVNRMHNELLPRDELSDTDRELVAPLPTSIVGESAYLMAHMTHYLPTAKQNMSEEDYSNYEYALAGVLWLYTQVSGRYKSPFKFKSEEEVQLFEGVKDKLEKIIESTEEGGFIPDQDTRDRITQLAVHADVPALLKFYMRFEDVIKNTKKIVDVIRSSSVEFSQAIKSMGKATAKLMEWGDIKNNPLGTLLNLINGVSEVLTADLGLCNAIVNSSNRGVSLLLKIFDDDEDDEKKEKKAGALTPVKALTNIFLSISSVITSVTSGLFAMIASAIQASFTIFTSILKSILTLVKSIAETSEVFKTILSYIDLAFTMFFLPFWTAFAEPLLDVVMSAYSSIIDWGVRFITYFQNADNILVKHIQTTISSLMTLVKEVLIDSMDMVMALAETILPSILGIATELIDWVTRHKKDIISFVTKGLKAATALVKAGIGSFLSSGSQWMAFVIVNAGKITSLFNTIKDVVNACLDVAAWGMKHAKAVTYALLTTAGTIVGAVTGHKIGVLLAPFTLGISLVATTAGGALVGGAIGLGASAYVYRDYLEPGLKLAEAFQAVESTNLTIDQDKIDAMNITEQDLPEFAKGGKIYGIRGGHLGLLGEAGQGEFAIPQSKMKLFRGNNNIILRFNKGIYNQKEIEPILKELQSETDFDYVFE